MSQASNAAPRSRAEGWDVSGLQPEARAIADAIVRICTDELGADLQTLLFHGSAMKGGIIPGSSDVDFVMIVNQDILTAGNELPLSRSIGLHRQLATIPLGLFRYLQGQVSTRDRVSGGGFVPGAYTVAYGSADVPLRTNQQLLDAATDALARLDRPVSWDRLSGAVLNHGEDRLFREVRWLCTDVWPTMVHIACLRENDGLRAWQRTKHETIALLADDPIIGNPLLRWSTAINEHYATGETVESGLAALEAGSGFLDAAARWYDAHIIVRSGNTHA